MDKNLFGEDITPATRVYFKACAMINDGGWMMCDAGRSAVDNKDWIVTTHYLKGDETPSECLDSKSFCELVSKLLNEHYNK